MNILPNNILIFGSSSEIRLKTLKNFGIEPDFVISPEINEVKLKTETPMSMARRLASSKCITIVKKLQHLQDLSECITAKYSSTIESSEVNNFVFVLSCDSVVSIGRRVLEKPTTQEEIEKNIRLLSGRSNTCYTAFCIYKLRWNPIVCNSVREEVCDNNKNSLKDTSENALEDTLENTSSAYDEHLVKGWKLVSKVEKYTKTKVKFKRLHEREIKAYIKNKLISETSKSKEGQIRASNVYKSEGCEGRFIESINGSLHGALNGLPVCEVFNALNSLGYIKY